MKKFITLIIAAVLAVQCTAFAENNGYVFRTKSSLADYLNLDFESRYPGSPVKEVRISSGNGAYKIMSENNETFLRLENYSDDKDCYFYFDLPKFADGEVAIEFDARISKIKYMQMPTVVGISDSKKSNVDLTRVVLSSSGTLSLDSSNVTKLTSSAGTKDWTKFIIYVNTETDTARLFVNNDASVPTKTLTGIYKVSALRFLLRGAGQKVDINNFSVYACRLNEDSLSEPSAEEAKGLALPVRHAKAPYVMTKADGNVNVDGDVSEWDNSLYVHLKKTLSGKTGTDVYAAAKYDDKGFYFAFKARDSILTGGMSAKPWLQDSFEVYIDGKDENTAFYQANDIQLVMPYGADGVYCSKQADGTVYKYSETDYGWCAEVFVPYTVIGGLTPEEGSTAGLDFGYNNSDKEGERQGQFMWSGSARNSTSTTAFGTAILS